MGSWVPATLASLHRGAVCLSEGTEDVRERY